MISALYTWRDVLAALVDNDISVVDASVDGIDAVIPSQSVLETIFGPRYDQSHSRVRLEHAPGASRHLPIHNVASGSQLPLLAVQRPLWSVLKQVESVPPLEWKYKCRVAAFASYKGGVGRTTTLFAVAASLLGRNPPPRVVIVDADAEAPGLTWMIPGAPERLSLIDLLALVHDADADWETALRPLITSRVPLNSATIEAPLGRVEYTFFPTVRDRSQLFPLPITPEHVVHGRGRAHAIAEILAFVGDCAGADIVLVDLRAGITELNSPFILDPRVQTVFVTSCGRQSVDGTLMVLDRIRARRPGNARVDVVVNQVPPDASDELVGRVVESLWNALPPLEGEPAIEAGVGPVSARYAQELLAFETHDELIARLPGTQLGRDVAPAIARRLLPEPVTPSETLTLVEPTSRATSLTRLVALTQRFEYAEQNSVLDLLPTPALENLVRRSAAALPSVVSIGSKGAGKTFAWGQMVIAGHFEKFATQVAADVPHVRQALVFPLLAPKNVAADLQAHATECEDAVWRALQAQSPLKPTEMYERLRLFGAGQDAISFWTSLIAARLGLPGEAGKSVESLENAIRARHARVLLVVDGLEDAHQRERGGALGAEPLRAIRGLLQDVVSDFRALRSEYLGVVAFARRDYAQEAVSQNYGQFAALHEPYAITWSDTDVLRLVAWLALRAGVEPFESQSEILRFSYEQLRAKLVPFWGEKLGVPRAKEAATDRWIMAALADLNGRMQPRDVVRLLRFACEEQRAVQDDQTAAYLSPRAIRQAIEPCAKSRIAEMREEAPDIATIFDRFERADAAQKYVPFAPQDFSLTPDDVKNLEREGIIIALDDPEKFYMPEIVRQGLGFQLRGGARAKVLTLLETARRKGRARRD